MHPAFTHPGTRPLTGTLSEGARLEPDPHPPSSRTLERTAAIARGDPAAFELLYRAWFDRLLALARAATRRDEAFCLDVVQDAFVRVIRSPRACPTEAQLAGWLRRCVLSAAVDRLRRDARRTAREGARGASEAANAAEGVGDAEQLLWLRDRLAELSPEDRDLLRLRFEIDRTLDEIAGDGRGTWGAVHGRLRRTLDRLRRAASEYFA